MQIVLHPIACIGVSVLSYFNQNVSMRKKVDAQEPFYWQQVLSWAACASLPGFIRYHFVNSYPLALKQLEALYIGRTYHAWKEPEVKKQDIAIERQGNVNTYYIFSKLIARNSAYVSKKSVVIDYSRVLSFLTFWWKRGWCWPGFYRNFSAFLMLMMLFSS